MKSTVNEKIVFFDLETKKLFSDVPGPRDPSKLGLAVAGILIEDKHTFFEEDKVKDLFKALDAADLIVGHNLLRFDYLVLQPYTDFDVLEHYKKKTIDMHAHLENKTGKYLALDHLAQMNIGMKKPFDGTLIPPLWNAGKHKEVKEYLLNDLKMTKSVFLHGKNTKKLKYRDRDTGLTQDIIIDW